MIGLARALQRTNSLRLQSQSLIRSVPHKMASSDATNGSKVIADLLSSPPHSDVDPESLKAIVQEIRSKGSIDEIQLVDVREPWELQQSQIQGFLNLPLSRSSEWAPQITKSLNQDKTTLVLCHHGVRSSRMCQFLRSQDFSDVRNITGGIDLYADHDTKNSVGEMEKLDLSDPEIQNAFVKASVYFEKHGLTLAETRRFVENNQKSMELLLRKKEVIEMQTQETKLNEEKEKKKILSDATYVLERIDSILPKIEEISSDVLQISKWGQKLEQMNASFKKQIYEDVVRNITQLQKQISESAHMSAKDLDIDPLLELHHVCQVIQLTPWKNLFDAAKQLFDHYHQSTLVKLREAFKVLISHMKWPRLRVMSSHTLPKSNQEINPEQMAESAESTKESFQIVLEKLLRLDPGVLKATKFEDVKDIHLIAFNDLMAPLEIRFQHHFEGTRKTNNIRKPEWYLTFTMDTIQDHLEFLLSNVHPIMVANIPYFYDAQTEFVRRMIFLVDRKLSRDLNLLMQNPAALLHTFEEIGQFEKDIAKIYDIPNEILTCMSVFTRDEEVWKFLLDTLREDYTTRFINDLEKVESWKMKFIQQQSVDEFKRAAIADILVINLKQLEDVTTCLSSASLKFQVANIVQNELLCSFTQKVLSRNSEHHSRLSSSQDPALSSELLKDICTSVNSAYYVEQILRDWENKELYIEIADYAKSRHPLLQPAEEDSHSGVFHHHISALSEVQAKGLELIRSHAATQFSIRSKSYFKRTVWSRVDLGAHLVSDELVPSGEICGMLAFLQQQFRTLEAILHPDLLRSTVRSVFRVVDKYIFEKTVDYFTLKLGQAAQFEVDMKAILEFSTHHHSTSETFLRLRGILRLISLSSNAFRELEQIVRQRNEALVKEALENLDMNDMNPSDVQEILDKIVVEEEKESQLT